MKSKNITWIAFLAMILMVQTSCQKDYLDLKPNNSITDENFYQTEEDAIRATNAAYTPAQGLYNGAAWQILDIMSDDADKGGGGAGDEADVNDLDNFAMNSFNPKITNYYTQCYLGIQRANLVIDRIPGIAAMSFLASTRSNSRRNSTFTLSLCPPFTGTRTVVAVMAML